MAWKEYNKFRTEHLYLLFDKVKQETMSVHLPNELFKLINEIDPKGIEVKGEQKAFACSMYPLVKLSSWKGNPLPISKIKELWGYSPKNKSLNELVKSGGHLDKHGITRTVGATKVQRKEPALDDDPKKGFFKLNPEIMLFSMFESEKIGTIGFTIYIFLCKETQMQGKGKNIAETALTYIALGTGLHRNTVEKYIKVLEKIGLIYVIRGDSIHNGEYGEFKNETNKYRINHQFNAFAYYNAGTITNESKDELSLYEQKQEAEVVSNPTFFDMGGDDLSWLYD